VVAEVEGIGAKMWCLCLVRLAKNSTFIFIFFLLHIILNCCPSSCCSFSTIRLRAKNGFAVVVAIVQGDYVWSQSYFIFEITLCLFIVPQFIDHFVQIVKRKGLISEISQLVWKNLYFCRTTTNNSLFFHNFQCFCKILLLFRERPIM